MVVAANFTPRDENKAWGQIYTAVFCVLCAMGLDGARYFSPQTALKHGLGESRSWGLYPRSRLDAATLFWRLKKCSPVEESQVQPLMHMPPGPAEFTASLKIPWCWEIILNLECTSLRLSLHSQGCI